jgi:hypothetical protein
MRLGVGTLHFAEGQMGLRTKWSDVELLKQISHESSIVAFWVQIEGKRPVHTQLIGRGDVAGMHLYYKGASSCWL